MDLSVKMLVWYYIGEQAEANGPAISVIDANGTVLFAE